MLRPSYTPEETPPTRVKNPCLIPENGPHAERVFLTGAHAKGRAKAAHPGVRRRRQRERDIIAADVHRGPANHSIAIEDLDGHGG